MRLVFLALQLLLALSSGSSQNQTCSFLALPPANKLPSDLDIKGWGYDHVNDRIMMVTATSNWMYSLAGNFWDRLPYKTREPKVTFRWSSMNIYEEKNLAVVFQVVGYTDMWTYDLQEQDWEEVIAVKGARALGANPKSRCISALTNSLYVFSGNDGTSPNILQQFNFTNKEWHHVPMIRTPPGRVSGNLVCDDRRKRIILYGGDIYGPAIFNDMHELDMETNVWTQLYPNTTSNRPPTGPFGGLHNKIFDIIQGVKGQKIYTFSLALMDWLAPMDISSGQLENAVNSKTGVLYGWDFTSEKILEICDGIGCARGTYLANNETGACANCSVGYASVPLATYCQICGRGTYATIGGCATCSVGRFSSNDGQTHCAQCQSGFVSTRNQTICLECGIGTYARISFCGICPYGRFSNKTQSVTCTACHSGKVSDQNRTSCYDCGAGTYDRRKTCTACPVGTFTNIPGSILCEMCPNATYTIQPGTSQCELCSGTFPPSDGYASRSLPHTRYDCYCKEGYYGRAFNGEQCLECTTGPGVSCPVNESLPTIDRGYFRSHYDVSIAIRCVPEEACQSTGTNTSTICTSGYTGLNCGECEAGTHFKYGRRCLPCAWYSKLNFLFFILLLLLGIFAVLKTSIPDYHRYNILSVTVYWVQILDIVAATAQDWPALVSWLFVLSSTLNFNIDVISPECSFEVSYWTKWHVKMTSILVLGSMELIFFVLQEWLRPIHYDIYSLNPLSVVFNCVLKSAKRVELGRTKVRSRT